MNNNNNELTDLEFRRLLQKKEEPTISPNLSNVIMGVIYSREAQRSSYIKYINRSWLFILVALLLSLFTIGSFSFIQAAFADYLNQMLPGLYDYFSIIMVTLVAGLFLYQLNQLLSYHFRKIGLAL
jgi:membrane protein insertase Oxa1/YidC/SpoIIIJ